MANCQLPSTLGPPDCGLTGVTGVLVVQPVGNGLAGVNPVLQSPVAGVVCAAAAADKNNTAIRTFISERILSQDIVFHLSNGSLAPTENLRALKLFCW